MMGLDFFRRSIDIERQYADGCRDLLAADPSAATVRKVHAILSSAYEIEVRRPRCAYGAKSR
jgi:hypothetical protein